MNYQVGIAGQLNGQLVNGQNIAREAGVSRSSVDVYFSILEVKLSEKWGRKWERPMRSLKTRNRIFNESSIFKSSADMKNRNTP